MNEQMNGVLGTYMLDTVPRDLRKDGEMTALQKQESKCVLLWSEAKHLPLGPRAFPQYWSFTIEYGIIFLFLLNLNARVGDGHAISDSLGRQLQPLPQGK